MRFMFFGPEVCLGLPSDSASPRTPLPPTTATAAFTAQDLHLVDNAHAGHTKQPGPSDRKGRAVFPESRKYPILLSEALRVGKEEPP